MEAISPVAPRNSPPPGGHALNNIPTLGARQRSGPAWWPPALGVLWQRPVASSHTFSLPRMVPAMYSCQKTVRCKAGEKPDCSPMIRKVNHIRNPRNLLMWKINSLPLHLERVQIAIQPSQQSEREARVHNCRRIAFQTTRRAVGYSSLPGVLRASHRALRQSAVPPPT
jgi:hypothetical protein